MTSVPQVSSKAPPIAHGLRRMMLAKGRAAKELALSAGLSETYIYDILRGRSQNPKLEEIKSLADQLGCAVADLVLPGAARQDHPERDVVDNPSILPLRPSEFALVRLWRYLRQDDKDSIMKRMAEMVPNAPDEGGSSR